jgi:nucleoside 2-deoxyribosyltransferase-like protein
MQEIKAPGTLPRRVFLAGSIEMGKAENWQERVASALSDASNLTILNPRRDNWDSSWAQSIHNPEFRGQVEWELAAQEIADVIFMYFAPDTKAPITLLELGLFARSGKLIVCCPDGFWRKGNVEVVCQRYGVKLYDSLEDAISSLRYQLRSYIA